MIARLIYGSINNRMMVLILSLIAVAWGAWSALRTPLDAIPDLSDVQVIIRTTYAGQAPQVVEDQVTYPLTTTMLSVPHAKSVRGYSMFGESLVYILFDDDTDLYWARSRVLEYLSQVQSRLPEGATSALGPDATGVGWIYEYALVDRTGAHDISELRTIQDWFLKYELKSVPGVAEVATLGGQTRQYQVVLDPDRLRAYGVTLERAISALRNANTEVGGSVLELSEAEYMVRMRGYLKDLEDFRTIPVGLGPNGTPVLLGDVATIRIGPQLRRGIAELDGEGEVVGGVVVMRYGDNALDTIKAVKQKIAAIRSGLPAGVELVETYDRSGLIERAVKNLGTKLIEEFVVVAVICTLFLFHLRSALVAILTLPVGILIAFIVMHRQGVNANIMSLGGIAIAIGAMVDAAVVMIENAHKKLEQWRHAHPNESLPSDTRQRLIADAAAEVGPALFFSLLIITLSFIPVFTLQAQEGRLFAPLAFTKTYAMAAAAALSVTLIPVLMTLFIRGKLRDEHDNPLSRWLTSAYRPLIERVLRYPRTTLGIALLSLLATAWPASRLGSEFIPPLDEGDLLYMPTALPGLSAGKAAQLLQQTDRIIKSFPEVNRVFGKIGRAETATDPAPLEMIETTIQLKPRDQWRPGMTSDDLIAEMDAALQIPGMGNVWVQPIRNRIDMLATGIKSPVGIKIAGPDLAQIDQLGARIESVVSKVPGAVSVFAERTTGGRYIEVRPDRLATARLGLSIEDVQRVIAFAVGGRNVGELVDGLARYPINVRYPRALRDSPDALRALPILTAAGATVTLGQIAQIAIVDGPPMIRSENARPAGYVYVDIRNRDLGSFVADAQAAVHDQIELPSGYSIAWSGQFEYLERASDRLKLVVPLTLAIIFLLLFMIFGRAGEAALIMSTLPFALVGGYWLIYLLGHHLSIASAVGFIALSGVAAEFGVVMLIYLQHALSARATENRLQTDADLRAAIIEGAVLRVRPKAMTVAVIIAGLLPLFWHLGGSATGSEMMQRIAAPMIGGMLTAPLLSMLVLPAAYLLIGRRRLARQHLPA
ncbi:efflux RND transporter permease subunit [Sinimarinibacterium sp. CAU 1509]|uniref:efflux RND transporter permease subunit n=1 Tax=Sinimarinibacterium sp. CAU 1509 TaxID=2562283 RepID=UPI0010ACB123|nr:efflux RND transporter permease subunit [Sinimarinibacterium sp. CAU 1509]TJY64868.1 efflux RND transporter permease subunit [Sinimarinibacterium sp. CAU 1509]